MGGAVFTAAPAAQAGVTAAGREVAVQQQLANGVAWGAGVAEQVRPVYVSDRSVMLTHGEETRAGTSREVRAQKDSGGLIRGAHSDDPMDEVESSPLLPRPLIVNVDEKSSYLLSWEEKFARQTDWNDSNLFAEVHADAAMEPVLIPLPPAASSGLMGLAAMAGVGVVRRARRRLRGGR